jgi:hypothetical protein
VTLAVRTRPTVRRENPRCSSLPGLTPALLGATEPVQKYGAGTCGTVDCCLGREEQTHQREAPSGRRGLLIVSEGGNGWMKWSSGALVLTCTVPTVRVPSEDRRRFKLSTRTFRATIGGLTELREWLAAFGVTLVGMEATGVYWSRCSRC